MTRINVPTNVSMANKIQGLVAAYSLDPESWILDHLRKRLETMDPDLVYAPPKANIALHKLLNIGIIFEKADATQAVREIEVSLYPPTGVTKRLTWLSSGAMARFSIPQTTFSRHDGKVKRVEESTDGS